MQRRYTKYPTKTKNNMIYMFYTRHNAQFFQINISKKYFLLGLVCTAILY